MRSPFRLLVPGLMLAVAAAPSLAADYEPPIVADLPPAFDEVPEFVPVEIGSGWYLRGDVGYAFTSASGPFTFRAFDAGAYTGGTFATGAYDGDVSFAVGFGYRFTDMLRADLTVENFNLRFNGTRAFAVPCPGENAGTTCTAADSTTLGAWSIMANGYLDLGTFARFTPYVGAGLGVTYANSGAGTTNYTCVGGACAGGTASLAHASIDSWRFTYAAMAGFAYDINKNLKLDLGYMFRHVGGGNMFGFNTVSAAAGATGAEATDSGFNQHQIKVGLRYELW